MSVAFSPFPSSSRLEGPAVYLSDPNTHPTSEREAQPEEDNSVPGRISRLEIQYKESGIRRSVDAVMVVQVSYWPRHLKRAHDEVRGFPHVLVLQVANAFYKL